MLSDGRWRAIDDQSSVRVSCGKRVICWCGHGTRWSRTKESRDRWSPHDYHEWNFDIRYRSNPAEGKTHVHRRSIMSTVEWERKFIRCEQKEVLVRTGEEVRLFIYNENDGRYDDRFASRSDFVLHRRRLLRVELQILHGHQLVSQSGIDLRRTVVLYMSAKTVPLNLGSRSM